jgi:hypothetical protein
MERRTEILAGSQDNICNISLIKVVRGYRVGIYSNSVTTTEHDYNSGTPRRSISNV